MYSVMVCLKDGDCFFPDATPSVTVLLWLMGGYDSWVQPLARMSGQLLALGVNVSAKILGCLGCQFWGSCGLLLAGVDLS